MKKHLLLIVCLLIAIDGLRANVIDSLKATSNKDSSYLQKNFLGFNLLLPGFSYETKLDKQTTLFTHLGITYIVVPEDMQTVIKYNYFNPFLVLNLRNYYNFDKRLKKGKNIKYNSANYFGISSVYVFKPFRQYGRVSYHQFEVGPVWGFKRTYKNRFNIDINVGVGYQSFDFEKRTPYYDVNQNQNTYSKVFRNKSGFTAIGMFHLGFYIGRKKLD